MEREKQIVLAKVPGVTEHLADEIARIVRSIRQLDLRKSPSVSETIDWARTLVLLGIDHVEAEQAKETLHILLKYQTRHHQGCQGAVGREHEVGRVLDLLTGFVAELRAAGLPVSLTENLDAMEAVQHIPLEDREAFKYALGATLVKNNAHWRSFETVFEVYFSLRGSEYRLVDGDDDEAFEELWRDAQNQAGQGGEGRGGSGGSMDALTAEQIAQMLLQRAPCRATRRRCARSPARPCSASPAWSPAAPSVARTTCIARCATSTSTG